MNAPTKQTQAAFTPMVNVRAVIEAHRDAWGDLDSQGRSLDEARMFSLRHAGAYDDAVRSQAYNLRAADESLRKAGRVPVIARYRRAALRQARGEA